VKASCRTHEWVMSLSWMSHVSHLNESCLTYEWVMSHIRMSHVSHEWVTSHIWISNVSHMNEPRLTFEWVMSHKWMSHVTQMNESCLAQFICVTCPIQICDITPSCVRHDSFTFRTWFVLNISTYCSHPILKWKDPFKKWEQKGNTKSFVHVWCEILQKLTAK